MITRRSAFAVFAAAFAAPLTAYAQAGGMPSSTAPSNSQGTPPGGGPGALSTTRFPSDSTSPAPAAAPARRRRRARRRTTPANGQ